MACMSPFKNPIKQEMLRGTFTVLVRSTLTCHTRNPMQLRYIHRRHVYVLGYRLCFPGGHRRYCIVLSFLMQNTRDEDGAAIAVFTAQRNSPKVDHEITINAIYLQLDESTKR